MGGLGRVQRLRSPVGGGRYGTPLIISELDEVVALADRIAVMYRGRIVGIVPPDTGRDVLGLMMAGVPLDEAMATSSTSGVGSDVEGQEK